MSLTEFDFIERARSRFGLDRIGDDCAVLPKDKNNDQIITADLLVEDIDFRLKWITPRQLGRKALAVSLSDIAAMGGDPKYALLSIGIPASVWSGAFLDDLYDGWHELAREWQVELVGGDVSRSDRVVIDSIVIGEVPTGSAILRSGARCGDSIFVTGTLGGAAGGLKLLEIGGPEATGSALQLTQRQLESTPQLAAGNYLRINGLASSMIDISDGLSSDLAHICKASGTGARVDQEMLPIEPLLSEFYSLAESLDLALNGGEDLGLLFTSPKKTFPMSDGVRITRIGEVTANIGIIELKASAYTSEIDPGGYRHF